MNILFYEWGSYIANDICETLSENEIKYRLFSYYLSDKHYDDKFENDFTACLKQADFDAVFSVNYFPIVARICHDNDIKYVSYSYDNPLNVLNIEETLGYSTNFVFFFDKLQVAKYRNMGFENVHHLPLAVNVKRLDKIILSANERKKYESDISFVGNLYSSSLDEYKAPMNEYQRGYIDGIINAQGFLYGYYAIDSMLTDSFMQSIQNQYQSVSPGTEFVLPREALSYAMAAEITKKERLSLLGLLSNHYDVALYSREDTNKFANIKYKGTCDYFTEMPKVFKASKINMNITLKILQSGIPLRVLDILGAGGFVLSNYQPEVAEYFVDGEEVVMYESIEDAFEKADFYLKNDEIRNKIAQNAHRKVSEEFTYNKRLEQILNTVTN